MNTSLRVLIVEDSEDDAALMQRALSRGGYASTPQRIDTPEDMIDALKSETWDLILSDHQMPHFNALDALAILRKTGLDVPFIIVSGTINEDTALAAMRAGAQDYVLKSNLARLCVAVERELGEAEVRRARDDAEEEQRRAIQKLEKSYQQVEQRFRELSALNRLFQEHLSERLSVVEALREFITEFGRLAQELRSLVRSADRKWAPQLLDNLKQIAEEIESLVARTRSQPLREFLERSP